MATKIFIDDQIGKDWWTGGGITFKWFKGQMDAALAIDDDIEVLINTPGGSILEGVAMYNLIAANRDRVTTINMGFAYSMGAVLLSAGGTRKAYNNATTMIHNASGGAWGNSKALKGSYETLEKLDDAMAESIAQFSGKTKEEVTASYFDFQDHTLSAEEALEAGIITEIIDLSSEAVPAGNTALSHTDVIALFQNKSNAPADETMLQKIIGKLRDLNPAALNKPVNLPQDNNLSDMKITINKSMTAMVAVLAISFAENETEKEIDLTAEHVNQINSALATANESLTTAQGQVTTLTNEKAALQEKVNKLPGGAPSTPVAGATNEGATTPAESVSIKAPTAQTEVNNNY